MSHTLIRLMHNLFTSFFSLTKGYSGESAHRIWRAIYEENCFLRPQTRRAQEKNPFALNDMCYEERVFYRAISGLHTSINIHLCANYPLVDGSFSYNVDEFVQRFKGMDFVSSNPPNPLVSLLEILNN